LFDKTKKKSVGARQKAEPKILQRIEQIENPLAAQRGRRIIPLADQDATLWDWQMIVEAETLLTGQRFGLYRQISVGRHFAVGAR
jgi:predicted RNA polymerase sigma factor